MKKHSILENQGGTFVTINYYLFNMKKVALSIILIIVISITNKSFSQNISGMTSVQLGSVIKSETKNNNSNSAFITTDVYDKDNNIWIKAGTPVVINITTQKAKGMGEPGILEIQCVSTVDINGRQVSLKGSLYQEGEEKKGTALGLGLGLGLTVLFPFGFFFFMIKGKNITIPPNTIIPNVIVYQ